jgi:hypothetical protein
VRVRPTPQGGAAAGSGDTPAPAYGADEAEREQADRGPTAEVNPILAVEGLRVAQRLPRRRVALRPAGAAATVAVPPHGRAVAREAEAMAEQETAHHPQQRYREAEAP